MLIELFLLLSIALNVYFWRKRIWYARSQLYHTFILPNGSKFVMPHSSRAMVRNQKFSVFLKTLKETIDITQPPGTMYPFSAVQLSGQQYIIVDNESKEKRIGSVKPGYLSNDDLKHYE